MNLLRAFVPAAVVMVSITTAAADSSEPPVGAAACSGCHPQDPLLKPAFRHSLVAGPMTLWRRCEHSGLANAARPLWIGSPRVFPTLEIDAIAEWYQAQR